MPVYRQWNGSRILGEIRVGQVQGLTVAAEHLLQVSRTLVPIDEATLERSGVASVDASERRAAVSYDTPYAVIQHEELTYRHDPGRQAKYLEQPFHTEKNTMIALVAAEVRRKMRG
ncbi:hypothetical protein [Dactylosporangium salmoneum]|uniref:HK97 gp10 family phage protein n=1 Tax=Dactylosporangium salmoneum TaxID=53361 RepID=A0ABN3FD40_9ACTN